MLATESRALLVDTYRDVEAALAGARKLLGAEATPEAVLRLVEAYLVHLCETRRQQHAATLAPAGDRAPAGPPAPDPAAGEVPRSCPVCEGPMKDQRASKRGNQPDFKCRNRSCDGAMWLDRTRGAS